MDGHSCSKSPVSFFYLEPVRCLPRSTTPFHASNMTEGWHNGFQSLVRCTNPTIWTYLDAIKLEQELTDQELADRLMLRPPPPRPQKWINLDTQLEEFVNANDNDQYDDVNDFLSAVSSTLF